MIHSLSILLKKEISKEELANEAIHLEQVELNENVGSQDQIACAIGGLNYIKFGGQKEWVHEPISISNLKKLELESRMILIYTGVHRSSSDVQANLLIDLNKKTKTMQRTIELARECKEVLLSNTNLDEIGDMLVESWSLKKAMNSNAITPALEEIWVKSQRAGALGGTVLGAGGGGFCMFWVKEDGQEEVLERFGFGTHVPVQISNEGSTCILK